MSLGSTIEKIIGKTEIAQTGSAVHRRLFPCVLVRFSFFFLQERQRERVGRCGCVVCACLCCGSDACFLYEVDDCSLLLCVLVVFGVCACVCMGSCVSIHVGQGVLDALDIVCCCWPLYPARSLPNAVVSVC